MQALSKEGDLASSSFIRQANYDAVNALAPLRGKPLEINPGSMYEVNLNTTPDRLLDWDAPLSRQGSIGEATRDVIANSLKIDASGIYNSSMPIGKFENALKGRDLSGGGAVRYLDNQAASELQGAGAVSSALRNAGIDGIQYLDAGSRAAGEGSRNYVMFDDKLIDILRRYGVAGTLGGGAAATSGTSE
jgi:hypothetical protein